METTEIIENVTQANTMQNVGLASILLGLAVFVYMYAMFAPRKNIERRYVQNLDETPIEMEESQDSASFDRYIRPMLRNFLPQSPLSAQLKNSKLDKVRDLLIKSGNPWNIRAEEFLGIQLLFALIGTVAGVLLMIFPVVPVVPPILWLLLIPLGLYMIPYSFHNSKKQARSEEIRKQLPEAIDLLVISISSGKTFEPAMLEVAPALPEGLLKKEFLKINGELNAGRTISEALLDFAHRSSSEEAETFGKAIVQAYRLGTDVSETLTGQATAAREAYEARVEKKIARLASMMMIPLVFTMIPSLILIILAPVMVSLSSSLG